MKSKDQLTIKEVYGKDIEAYFEDLSRIRLTVFREWPYLYEGSEEYEREYLQSYFDNERSLGIFIYDKSEVVGISTMMPLIGEPNDFKKPLADRGFDLSKIFYYSESCLLRDYRGLGLYPEIFKIREAHVRRFGNEYESACFCAVERPENHPLRPSNPGDLHKSWRAAGFEPVPNLQMSFVWKDIDEEHESRKYLDVWMKHFK